MTTDTPVAHVLAFTLTQIRASIRALADTAGVTPQDAIRDDIILPHLTDNEFGALIVLVEAHTRACRIEGIQPSEGWTA